MNTSQAEQPRANLRLQSLAVFGVWTLYGLILLSQSLLNRPPSVPAPWKPYGPFLLWMGHAWAWAAVTPLIALLIRRARPTLASPVTWTIHLAAIVVIHALMAMVDAGTFYFVAKRLPVSFFDAFRRGSAQTALLYATVAFAVLALDHARIARSRAARAAQLEGDLARAQLETLRRQLQPHFLFNTLNTIAELIESDPPRASEMVTRLGDLLRRSLDERERPLIPLQAELDFVRLYSDIERVRFEGWLSIIQNVDRSVSDAWVPPMVLQPLVENAIKHGIAPSNRKGTVSITAGRSETGELRLEVADDGVGLKWNEGKLGAGIGLKATRARLHHQFGENARLEILSNNGAGTRVQIHLPLMMQG